MDLFVGTYSHALGGVPANGKGIYRLNFDAQSGQFGAVELYIKTPNPSAILQSGKHLYAVSELAAEDRPAINIFENGASISRLEIAGASPCHLAFDKANNRIASAQYGGGNVVVAEVATGRTLEINFTGSGPNQTRQEAPHAHWVGFSDQGQVLHTVDLGSDCIWSHQLSADLKIIETTKTNLSPGAGPRHMVLKNDSEAFLLTELDETLIQLTRNDLGWQIGQGQSLFPDSPTQDGTASAIRLSKDGKDIYVSARAENQILHFDANTLAPKGTYACGGDWPREFILSKDQNWLIVANQLGNSLTSLRRDPNTGELSAPIDTCAIGSPVALLES